MFNEEMTPPVQPDEAPTAPERRESSRRDFLRQVALAGAGAAALATLGQETAEAAPLAELVLGTYSVNHAYALNTLRIESQSGPVFVGHFDDGSSVSGSIVGSKPYGITLMFHRVLGDGSTRLYSATAATRNTGASKEVLLAGSFYQDGSGPLPWFATGIVRG